VVDSPILPRQLIGNLPRNLENRPLTEEEQEIVRQVEEKQDPGGVLRSRFQRPVVPAPDPRGLSATPQVQEEEGMFDFNVEDIKSYIGNLFSSTPPAIEEPVSRTKSVQKPTESPHPEPEADGGIVADDSFDEAILHTIRYYEGDPILKARKPVKGDPYTVGYGRTRDDQGNLIKKGTKITEEQADRYLREDVKKRMPELRKAYPDFNSYPAKVQQHIASSYYRGTLTPSHSPKTRKLINAGKFEEAAAELLDNDEYRNAKKNNRAGIRNRMEDTATALLSMEPARQAATGGRLASNPNPYEPKAI
tara:strand:+ start:181 stop:1098 length:918 start_codon:yes stop_codon:yes gene_type:complete